MSRSIKEVWLYMKDKRLRVRDYVFITAGILLFLTLLSFWLVCGLFAKYTTAGLSYGGARVAAFGSVEVKEHKAVLKEVEDGEDVGSAYYGGLYDDMVYYLLDPDTEVNTNTYEVGMPGVDIPKDPFVRVVPGEVDCRLYIEVTMQTDFSNVFKDKNDVSHDLITYKVNDSWTKIEGKTGPNNGDIYQYHDVIQAGSEAKDLYILKDNKITVSQYYDADKLHITNEEFSITFRAWMAQAD